MQIKSNYPISQVTTLRIGGLAEKFVSVDSQEELIEAINFAKQNDLEFLVIGEGSNLLVSDEGVDKLIIKNEIRGITTSKVGLLVPSEVEGNSFEVKVASGTTLQNLVDYSIKHGLAGLQKMTGIPGTVGGAIFGNAGAYGQTISDHLISVRVLNPNNLTIEQFSNKECNFNYRDSIFKKNGFTIIEATLQLENGDGKKMQEEADETLSKRLVKYPKGVKCPGSFFKNIPADTLPKVILDKVSNKVIYGKLPAGALLEEVGAKGDSEDGIEIASYHANLFVNKGGGTAQAFHKLAKKYSDKVYTEFGIKLEPEVQLINLPPLIV